jgi:hypothetical protein
MQFMASLNVPGAYLAESFPLLRYIPSFLAPWKRNIFEKARLEADANMALVEGVKRDLRAGQEKGIAVAPSLTRKDAYVAKRAPFLEILSLE